MTGTVGECEGAVGAWARLQQPAQLREHSELRSAVYEGGYVRER